MFADDNIISDIILNVKHLHLKKKQKEKIL